MRVRLPRSWVREIAFLASSVVGREVIKASMQSDSSNGTDVIVVVELDWPLVALAPNSQGCSKGQFLWLLEVVLVDIGGGHVLGNDLGPQVPVV